MIAFISVLSLQQIMDGGSVREVIGEMKSMLNTPIKAYTPPGNTNRVPPPSPGPSSDTEIAQGNLPAQFVRLMGKGKTAQMLFYSPKFDQAKSIKWHLDI